MQCTVLISSHGKSLHCDSAVNCTYHCIELQRHYILLQRHYIILQRHYYCANKLFDSRVYCMLSSPSIVWFLLLFSMVTTCPLQEDLSLFWPLGLEMVVLLCNVQFSISVQLAVARVGLVDWPKTFWFPFFVLF